MRPPHNVSDNLWSMTSGARSIVACGFQGERLTRQAPCRRVSLRALSCHPERSEGSDVPGSEILRCAQDDKPALRMTGLGGRSHRDGRPALSGFTHRANKERAPHDITPL